MSVDRYVVLGLAHVRSAWFTEVARWSTAGSLPVEFVKCVSVEELRARVASGRRFSAALLDARLTAVDRDLIATLGDRDVPAIVVLGQDERTTDWTALGAVGRLAPPLERAELLGALAAHAAPVGIADDLVPATGGSTGASAAWRGRLVTVVGRPGAGTSTLAAALAQGLAHDPRYAGDVVLADLARHAHQALLHDARDIVPGLQELAEAHRSGRPSVADVRDLTFDVPARGYRLLLGLRRPRDWVSLRSRSFTVGLEGLRRSARIVVAETDADLEGEAETGSFDIEDRHLVARTAVRAADLVVVVALPTTSGLHGLVGLLADLRSLGVEGGRTLVVLNRAPRGPRQRAELSRAVAALTGSATDPDPALGPAFVGDRRQVDRLHQDLARFPGALVDPVSSAVRQLLDRLAPNAEITSAGDAPVPISPGSLGTWRDEGATS